MKGLLHVQQVFIDNKAASVDDKTVKSVLHSKSMSKFASFLKSISHDLLLRINTTCPVHVPLQFLCDHSSFKISEDIILIQIICNFGRKLADDDFIAQISCKSEIGGEKT